MDNLIIEFGYIGEGTMIVVDDNSYDILFKIYDSQKPDGYEQMYGEFYKKLDELDKALNFDRILLQYNSHDHLDYPIKFKRMLQVLSY